MILKDAKMKFKDIIKKDSCIICFKEYNKNVFNKFISGVNLCSTCYQNLDFNRRKFNLDGVSGESFYIYDDSYITTLFLTYKHKLDYVLKDVFLCRFKEYINLKYCLYTIVFVPSSKEAIERRNFDHLASLFEQVSLKKLHLFKKIKDIEQKNLSFKDRSDILNYIELDISRKIPKKILLVDDIITSGSSLRACVNLLRNVGVKDIKILTLFSNKTLDFNIKM